MSTTTSRPAATAEAGRGHIRSLTGLRAVLAGYVLLIHLTSQMIDLVPALGPAAMASARHHHFAIDTFFLLSGYVLTAGYRRVFASRPSPARYARFLWARLARFYPVHLAVLGALVLAAVVGPAVGLTVDHGGNLGGDLVRHVLLLQGWGGGDALTWNGPSWTVSSEWACYLVAPLVVLGVVRLRRSGIVLACYAAAMAFVLVPYAILGFDEIHLTVAAPLWRALGGFVAGSLLFQLTVVGSRLPAWCGRWTGALVIGLLGVVVGLSVLDLPTMLCEPLLGLVLVALAQQRGAVNRVLAGRLLVRAGELSVALYLTHVPWLMLAGHVVNPESFPGAWGWVGVLLLVAGAFVVAHLTFVLVERPAARLMQRVAAGRAATPAPVAPAAVPPVLEGQPA